ncbi:F0F1 ATP synthase subunit epsilon [Zavarzinia compransoris]|uniref:ATP synthase epsilon chain n=1 Tax=Zavarzinia compransoris TaxID=1264899 RepID=A0A317E3W7_9PROT|nr:F0F1 ATP synthase subunit epsilon [Zavarzinia compransoris]PWR20846.1 F0F1 ATP synthase subunit epsilon [Zavarzinia compransoris]TDP44318.1 ATP synthase F1 subcomplex epsilon subunit [Zavarzinia compransoris]
MADKLHFELVSPERLLFSADVETVTVPGAEGDLGILVDHAPLVALLRPGVVEVQAGGKVTARLFVRGGFAQVTPEGLTVLAEEAVDLATVSKADLQDKLKGAEADLAASADDNQRIRAEAQVAAIRQVLEAA